MTEREALLAAVCANAEDDTPRLAFADWFRENGNEARAEFIQSQVRLAELLRMAAPGTDAVSRRARELWLQHRKKWRQELPQIDGVVWHEAFSRGFVERAMIANDAILIQHADVIFNQAPLLHLVIERFEGTDGFISLAGLSRLRTLSLTNLQASEFIVRRLLHCNVLAESMMLMCYFGPLGTEFYAELHGKFGERLFRPTPPQPRLPGVAYRGS